MTLEDKADWLDRDQVKRAVVALQDYVTEQRKANLGTAMDDVEPIQLQFTFQKVPSEESTIKIPLPHSLVQETSDVCLIVKDLNRANRDYQPTIKHYKKLLAKSGITAVSEVIPLKQIKLEYQAYEAKRNLSNMYDVHLADATVVRLLPQILGKAFYGRKRFPIQVNLDAADLNKEITKALHLSYCVLTGKGPSGLVKVAHSGLGVEESVENILSAAEKLGQCVPGGATNIRNMHIKTADSPALPIYMALDKGDVDLSSETRRKRKGFEMEPEEISTVMGAKVLVTSRGKVKVISNQKAQSLEKQKQKQKQEAVGATGKKKQQSENTKNKGKKVVEKKANDKSKKGAASPATKKKNKKKTERKKTATVAAKAGEEEMSENEDSAELNDVSSEYLEMRRSRDLDADLFSDTTADSELSETEEMPPAVPAVKDTAEKAKTGKKTEAKRGKQNAKTVNKKAGQKAKSKGKPKTGKKTR